MDNVYFNDDPEVNQKIAAQIRLKVKRLNRLIHAAESLGLTVNLYCDSGSSRAQKSNTNLEVSICSITKL